MSESSKKSRYILLALALAGAAWWWHGGGSGQKKDTSSEVNVTLATAERRDIPFRVPLVGNVVAFETVALKSRIDSQVTEVHFKDGDAVKEGQLLFELDDRAVKAQISQFTSALNKEQATLVNAQLQYSRAQQLRKTQVVAQAQVEEAKAAFEAQQALVASAQANLENAQVLLTFTRIHAPISGRTGTINVTRGNNVRAGDTAPMVVINQISPIRVQTAIPQRYYEAVRKALSAGEVRVTAQNKDAAETATGTLDYLENSIDVSSGTFVARAKFENTDEKLWPGMFVNVVLDLGTEKNSLVIPAVAVQGDDGKRFVFVGDTTEKKARRRSIEIGMINSEIATVTKGLETGEQVIVDGILRVTDGTTIAYQSAPPPEAEK